MSILQTIDLDTPTSGTAIVRGGKSVKKNGRLRGETL